MAWETNNLLPRAEAIKAIQDKAREEELTGVFKVYYDGVAIVSPENLPEQVDMDKVKVSGAFDNGL